MVGFIFDMIAGAIGEFVGWLTYDIWKEGREKRRLKRDQRKKRNGPIDYG